jgi:heat shock protein HslJ
MTMANLRRRFAGCLVCVLVSSSIWPAVASERAFPFDRELMLDTAPMPGSKRVPILEIAENGAASIDLWCASARGQASIGGDSITIVAGPIEPAQCAPERQSGDENLLAALVQVTNWRRSGDVIELQGATTLRFRLMTN